MARTGQGTLEEILQACVDRIIDQVPLATAANCYLCLDPDSVPPSSGEFIFAVAPLSGQFEEGMWDGGGLDQATVDSGLIVKIHSPLQLDEPQRDREFLLSNTHSVLKQHRLVIKALCDPTWSPMRGEDEIIRDPIIPGAWSITRRDRGLGAIEQEFRLNFDMDFSPDEDG